MACTSPKKSWIPEVPNAEGKRTPIFHPPTLATAKLYNFWGTPCGKCLACQKSRATNTATQLYCELVSTKGSSFFLTFTYDDDHLPLDGSISYRHMKNLIQTIRRKLSDTVRYLSQNEYGSAGGRAHLHLALFGIEIDDLEIYNNKNSFTSETINKIWGKGQVIIQRLEFGNCYYIAKHHYEEKANQTMLTHKYSYIHPVTGEFIKERKPEQSTRSIGIGRDYYDQYFSDLFPSDTMIINGQAKPVPKYFMNKLKLDNPELYEELKKLRLEKVETLSHAENKKHEKFNRVNLKSSLGRKR